jgi:UDP-N-acetylmuramate--alanine ligase
LVADAVRAFGTEVHYVAHRSELAAAVASAIAPGDLLLTLGAGDITGLATELVELGER